MMVEGKDIPSHRDRLWKAEHFAQPDRLPLAFGIYPGLVIRQGREIADLMRRYDFDSGPVDISAEESRELNPDYEEEDTDDWGVGWRHIKEGHRGQPIRHPVEDWSAMATFTLPPGPPAMSGKAFEEAKAQTELRKREYMVGGGAPTIGGLCFFERMQWLRGFEHLMYDLVELPPQIIDLADRIVEWNRSWVEYNLALGVDQVGFADDWCPNALLPGRTAPYPVVCGVLRHYAPPDPEALRGGALDRMAVATAAAGWHWALWPEVPGLGAPDLGGAGAAGVGAA